MKTMINWLEDAMPWLQGVIAHVQWTGPTLLVVAIIAVWLMWKITHKVAKLFVRAILLILAPVLAAGAASLGLGSLLNDIETQLGLPPSPSVTASQPVSSASPPVTSLTGKVSYIDDGDTLIVKQANGQEVTVRLLGIDADEVAHGSTPAACGGDAGANNLRHLLPLGTTVTATPDPVSDTWDQYGRLLAYLDATAVGLPDVALAQVAQGYAEAWVPSGEPRPARFNAYKQAQQVAQQAKLGAWASCQTIGR